MAIPVRFVIIAIAVVLVVWAEYEKLVGLHLFGPVQWPVTELFECFYI